MSALVLQDVCVRLGSREVVSGIDATFPSGALVAILGPNGAGKTTLVRAIAGLVPHAGRIDLDGRSLSAFSAPARARLTGYLPQGHVAHWPLAARDIVSLGLYAQGARDPSRLTAEQTAAVDAAMRLTGTLAFAERPVTELSGGERARVALARVIAGQPPVILADEPTASLDPHYQLDMMSLLRAEADRGRLVVAVTHDLTLAARHADLVMVLAGGRVAALGPPGATLTADLMREVFAIDVLAVERDGTRVLVPWQAV
ncbi:ABC transporter ATP-binding protein [Phreatobacter sp.]|uniref:ABC transporter ATP-binding protein n=1 Tax=Phreatobacter sp. TaxID=1966341 RepID=UPI003F6E50ED